MISSVPIRRLPPDDAPTSQTMGLKGHPRNASKEAAITATKLAATVKARKRKMQSRGYTGITEALDTTP